MAFVHRENIGSQETISHPSKTKISGSTTFLQILKALRCLLVKKISIQKAETLWFNQEKWHHQGSHTYMTILTQRETHFYFPMLHLDSKIVITCWRMKKQISKRDSYASVVILYSCCNVIETSVLINHE